MVILGAVETGGTTCKVSIAVDTPTNVTQQRVIPTTTPGETLALCAAFFNEQTLKPHAIGVASFGPLDLNERSATYGHITSTPKLAWQHTDVLAPFRALNVPLGFQTE
jgi:fructokinase